MKKIFPVVAFLVIIMALFFQILPATPVHALTDSTPSATTIQNPLKATTIECFISKALSFVVNLLAIAAVLYIMWAGFLFVKAQGNPDELKTAKQALLHALIGTAIVLGAWALATVIANTVNKVSKENITLPNQNSCK